MAQYLLSVHTVDGEHREPMTEEQMQRSYEQISALEEDMRAAGAWLFSGRLHDPDSATVVRRSADDQLVTTDGPFAESKEHIAGFYIIEAADLDAALMWASRTTTLVGAPIEVRPFMSTDAN